MVVYFIGGWMNFAFIEVAPRANYPWAKILFLNMRVNRPVPTNIHPSLLERKIIHFDMDAFYAAVEIRDNPSLRGKPVIIGGPPNSRAVVCTASYEARKYGIRSAMPCARVVRLCPKAIFIRPNFAKYSAVSMQIRGIFLKYTSLIEPISLDEAYLDVTENEGGLYAVKIARLIQMEIYQSMQLTGSAGVAPNKLLAKIASDLHKPYGLTVVLPENAEAFMGNLTLRKIQGIGPVTEARLREIGLNICRDVWPYSLEELRLKLGNMAEWLYLGSRGIDVSPLRTDWLRKSIGREETFSHDIDDLGILARELALIVTRVAEDLKEENFKGRTVTLKVRYDDFKRITRSHTLPLATDDKEVIGHVAAQLILATDAGRRKIRLLGVALSNLQSCQSDGNEHSPQGSVGLNLLEM